MNTFQINEFYVYSYLRKDGSPYYIGKGKKTRAYDFHGKHIAVPKDKSRIQFVAKNLTEQESLNFEVILISKLGRKDNGTGILRNLTNGGEGTSGYAPWNKGKKLRPHSEETKLKMHLTHTRNKTNLGSKRTPEQKQKMSFMRKGRTPWNKGKTYTEEHKQTLSIAHTGKKVSEETKRKMSLAQTKRYQNKNE